MELDEALGAKVAAWREAGYPSDVPALTEILDFAVEDVESGTPWPRSGQLRFLRAAQLRALEPYWYLRGVERTPPIPDLYGACSRRPLNDLRRSGSIPRP